jgi:copper(I)-binding protein
MLFVGGGCAGDIDVRRPVATAGQLAVYDALAPASPAPEVASLYFTVVNFGARADTLEQIGTPLGTAQLHTVVTEGGRSLMRHVEALEIPPGDTVRLAPGGYHVMLTDLATPLRVGDTLRVTITFARGGTLMLDAPVLTYTDVLERLEAGESDKP